MVPLGVLRLLGEVRVALRRRAIGVRGVGRGMEGERGERGEGMMGWERRGEG